MRMPQSKRQEAGKSRMKVVKAIHEKSRHLLFQAAHRGGNRMWIHKKLKSDAPRRAGFWMDI